MNRKYKEDFIKAGALAREVRAFGKSLIQKNSSYNQVIAKILEKISALGAKPAFPPQMALNHVAAHFLPQPDEDVILSDQVVKLDIGVCYQGAIGDCAVTIDLSGKYQPLIDAAEAALLAAERNIKVGIPLREIGKIIEETIKSKGFSVVKNLAGHGLGFNKVHTPPMVPNYYDQSKSVVKAGMTFAIEPFATNGRGYILEEGDPTIFSWLKKRPVNSAVAAFLVEKIKEFDGLPFALHDFCSDKYSLADVRAGIYELLDVEAIAGYAPLVEREGSMVAQAENSVLVDERGNVFITTR